MKRTYDRLQGMDLMHPHKPEDITGLADLLKGFIGSLDVSSGTEDNPFPPPQIETSGFWMISIAGFVDLDGSSVAFEPGDLLVFDLSEYIYSRVPSIKELPVGENPGSVLFWDGTKWDSYTKFILQEDTLVITNNDTFKFVISGDNTGNIIEFNDDIGGVFLGKPLYLDRDGIYLLGTNDNPTEYLKFLEPVLNGNRPVVNLRGINGLQFNHPELDSADLHFDPFGPGRFAFIGNNYGITYLVFEDGDDAAFMALGTDLMYTDKSDLEIQLPFIQLVLDVGDTTRVDLHNIYKLHFWDEVNQAEGSIKLYDSEYYFLDNLNGHASIQIKSAYAEEEVQCQDIISTKNIFFKYHKQASAPTTEQLTTDAACMWEQTGTNKTYLCLNVAGSIRKVEIV